MPVGIVSNVEERFEYIEGPQYLSCGTLHVIMTSPLASLSDRDGSIDSELEEPGGASVIPSLPGP
jgi:hypothetical protein